MEDVLYGRVYAPGMTCVYDQLFAPVVAKPWMAHRWKDDYDGAPDRIALNGDPVDLLASVILGDIGSTAHLYAQPDAVRAALGTQVEYDVLAVESRWLAYDQSLLAVTDWKRLEENIAPVRDRAVYFIDVSFPHFGDLSDLAMVRPLSRDQIRRAEQRSVVRYRLLDLLSGFRQCTLVDVTALAANDGYRHVCVDQLEHLVPAFRTKVAEHLVRDPDGSTHGSNAATLERLMARVADRQVDFEFVGGLTPTTAFGSPLLSVRVIIHSPDPLQCPTTIVVRWLALADCTMNWFEFHVRDGLVHYKAPLRPQYFLSYVQQLIAQKTAGSFIVEVVD